MTTRPLSWLVPRVVILQSLISKHLYCASSCAIEAEALAFPSGFRLTQNIRLERSSQQSSLRAAVDEQLLSSDQDKSVVQRSLPLFTHLCWCEEYHHPVKRISLWTRNTVFLLSCQKYHRLKFEVCVLLAPTFPYWNLNTPGLWALRYSVSLVLGTSETSINIGEKKMKFIFSHVNYL